MARNIEIEGKRFMVPEEGDPCDIWRAYYMKLKEEVGKNNARTLWLVTWNYHGSTSCTTNADFNQFLAKNDIDVSTAATRAVASVSAIGENILGLGVGLSKLIRYGGMALLCLIIGIILYKLITSNKSELMTTAMNFHPAGRAMNMAGATKMIGR